MEDIPIKRRSKSNRIDFVKGEYESFIAIQYEGYIYSGRQVASQKDGQNIMNDKFIKFMLSSNIPDNFHEINNTL
jgi:hypothetical protein